MVVLPWQAHGKPLVIFKVLGVQTHRSPNFLGEGVLSENHATASELRSCPSRTWSLHGPKELEEPNFSRWTCRRSQDFELKILHRDSFTEKPLQKGRSLFGRTNGKLQANCLLSCLIWTKSKFKFALLCTFPVLICTVCSVACLLSCLC